MFTIILRSRVSEKTSFFVSLPVLRSFFPDDVTCAHHVGGSLLHPRVIDDSGAGGALDAAIIRYLLVRDFHFQI